MIRLERTSMLTGTTRTKWLDTTIGELLEWRRGLVIQRACPRLTAEEREFVKTGITADEWDAMIDEGGQR